MFISKALYLSCLLVSVNTPINPSAVTISAQSLDAIPSAVLDLKKQIKISKNIICRGDGRRDVRYGECQGATSH